MTALKSHSTGKCKVNRAFWCTQIILNLVGAIGHFFSRFLSVG